MKRCVWWTVPGVYVPSLLVTGWWAWDLWTRPEPPLVGVYIGSRDAAYRLEDN